MCHRWANTRSQQQVSQVFLDPAIVKSPLDGRRVSKPNWRIIVKKQTQNKFYDFYETKNGMVEPTHCNHFLILGKQAILYVLLDLYTGSVPDPVFPPDKPVSPYYWHNLIISTTGIRSSIFFFLQPRWFPVGFPGLHTGSKTNSYLSLSQSAPENLKYLYSLYLRVSYFAHMLFSRLWHDDPLLGIGPVPIEREFPPNWNPGPPASIGTFLFRPSSVVRTSVIWGGWTVRIWTQYGPSRIIIQDSTHDSLNKTLKLDNGVYVVLVLQLWCRWT
jgi:hypothetical protein